MDCPSCNDPNPEGARFCGNCGASLDAPVTCPSCAASNPAGQRFCNGCGHELTAAKVEATPGAGPAPTPALHPDVPEQLAQKIRDGAAMVGERKHVTVLFADVMGSMDLAEQNDPEEWRQIMERFFAILCEGVHRFEGTVDKFTGDGIMALFGAPIAHEDHAQRACYAVLHLQGALASYAAELRRERGLNFSVRIGLNSGEVVVGAIGEDLGMEYTAIGHTVGLAQRMEQLAEPGKAYLTEYTAGFVEGYLELTDLGEFQVKGASRPLGVYELTGVGAARGRLDISRARGFSRFVGRDEEAQALEEALEQAAAGRPQVIGIVGEAGVGKSRVCDVFIRRCRARGIPVYQTSGQAHATSIPLLPVLQIMRAYFDVTDLDSEQTARERIAGKLLLLDEGFGEDLPLIFDFLGVPDPERPSPRMDPEAHQRRLLDLTKRLIRAQSGKEPGVTVFEDLHWLDPATEAFLANHVEATQGTRSLTVCNFRPEYRAPWMSKSYYRQIALAPLGPEATEELLDDLLGSDPSLNGLPDLIRQRTAGNPFFIEEVVRSLAQAGNLEGERGAYRLAQMVDAEAVPASVQAIISARIDRLSERDKAVLQAAAVIGKEFPQPTLAAVAGLDSGSLAEALKGLLAGEFIFESELYPETIYAFAHPLTQEVAYRSQLGERRSATHAAVARAIAERHDERHDEMAALLAQHWENAGEALEAARWHARAAVWAGTKDPTAALQHWRAVRESADAVPDSEEAAGLGLSARIFALTYGWRLGMGSEEAEALFTEGRRMAVAAQNLWSHALLLAAYGSVRALNHGDFGEYASLAQEAVALADESGDPALNVIVSVVAYAFFVTGDSRDALPILDRAIELADGDPEVGAGIAVDCPLAYCLVFKGGVVGPLGRLDEARELTERGTQIAAEMGAIETVGWGHMMSAAQADLAGEPESVTSHAQQAFEIAERIGDSLSRTWAWFWVGVAANLRGEWQQAIEALEQAEVTAGSGVTDSEGWRLFRLGEAYAGLGEAARGLELLREAAALLRRRGQVGGELPAQLALAGVLMKSGGLTQREEVEAALARADEIARQMGMRGWEPGIHEARAELARLGGDEAERERELREAHRLFTQVGATRHAERLAGELSALAR